jgi:hypothetical protein
MQNTNATHCCPSCIIEFSLAECCPTRRMTFRCLQWPLEYLTRVQTLNYHLESKAISISIQISRAIQDLLDYLPNRLAQLKILIPQCLLTLVGMRSRLMITSSEPWSTSSTCFKLNHILKLISDTYPLYPPVLKPFAANCYYSTLHSKVKPNDLKSS